MNRNKKQTNFEVCNNNDRFLERYVLPCCFIKVGKFWSVENREYQQLCMLKIKGLTDKKIIKIVPNYYILRNKIGQIIGFRLFHTSGVLREKQERKKALEILEKILSMNYVYVRDNTNITHNNCLQNLM